MPIEDLPTLAEIQALRASSPNPKSVPTPIRKDREKKTKKVTDDEFRALIWKLDDGKSRATGKRLVRSGTTDWHALGEVDHAIPRSLAPDRIYDRQNALLLSKWENRMRKIPCVRAPEHRYFDYSGPDNCREPQTYLWRDDDGKVIKTRVG